MAKLNTVPPCKDIPNKVGEASHMSNRTCLVRDEKGKTYSARMLAKYERRGKQRVESWCFPYAKQKHKSADPCGRRRVRTNSGLDMTAVMFSPLGTLIPAAVRSVWHPCPSSSEHDGHHAQPARGTDSRSRSLCSGAPPALT